MGGKTEVRAKKQHLKTTLKVERVGRMTDSERAWGWGPSTTGDVINSV